MLRMSLAPSALCSICKENFKDGDEVRSISCGHVFHYACIQEWGTRSTVCPQCRFQYENTQKLLLKFNESRNDVYEKLQEELQSNETELRQLEQQYNITKEEVEVLRAEVSTDNDIEKEFLALQKLYTEIMDDNAQIERQNECLSLQIADKTKEISSLKEAVVDVETPATDSNLTLEQEVKILEQKLEHITKELHVEVSNSMRLSIEKIKLQNLVDQYSAIKVEEHSIATPSTNNATTNNAKKPEQKNAIKKESHKEKKQTLAKNKLSIKTRNYFTSVVLKLFPSKHVRYPLADVVVAFAAAIEIQLSVDDVYNVRVHEQRPTNQSFLQNQVGLEVQFKTLQLKIDFLRNKSKVKNHPEYGSVLISEYMNENTYSLLCYAKKKLKTLGFSIAYQRGQIKALHNNNGTKGSTGLPQLCIENRGQVDDLARSSAENKENFKSSVSMLRSLQAGGIKKKEEDLENDSNNEVTDSDSSSSLSFLLSLE
ncbi:uncharacterized protein ACN427_008174 [Glossina fuscipes fuscipes]